MNGTTPEDRNFLRRIDRLVNFSDGVLAIAVTLLVLPLADKVSTEQFTSFQSFFDAIWQQFLLFTISFIVICRFWLIHHNIFQPLGRFNGTIFSLNCLWLFTIVLIPFFTELLGRELYGGPLVAGLYIFNILVLSFTGVLIQLEVKKHPELQVSGAPMPFFTGSVSAVILILVALLLTVLFSVPYPWLLMLLLLSGRLQKVINRFASNS